MAPINTSQLPAKDPLAQPYRLGISSTDLKRFPIESELILRVGAISNGVVSMARSIRRNGEPGRIPDVDDVYYMVVASGWLKELCVILHKDHDGLAWKMLERGLPMTGHTFHKLSLDELRTMTEQGSAFRAGCASIRDKFAFHMDPKPFRRWLDLMPEGKSVAVFTSTTGWVPDIHIDISVFAIRRAINDVGSDLFYDITRVAGAVPLIVEAMLAGFSSMRGVRLQVGPVPAELQQMK